jgi:hypothetical protein
LEQIRRSAAVTLSTLNCVSRYLTQHSIPFLSGSSIERETAEL